MLGISHLLISGTATSLLLGTASPTMIAVGAIAGLLPDIDISTSPKGRVLPWISRFFETRMPHRSCTRILLQVVRSQLWTTAAVLRKPLVHPRLA